MNLEADGEPHLHYPFILIPINIIIQYCILIIRSRSQINGCDTLSYDPLIRHRTSPLLL